jgi:hypothetical protein
MNGQGQEISRQSHYLIATPHAYVKIIFTYFELITPEDKLNKTAFHENLIYNFKNLLLLKINK